MSVRKLALAITSRVNELRDHFSTLPQRAGSALAIATVAICGAGVSAPSTSLAQVQPSHTPFQDPFAFDPDFRWFEPIYQADFEDMKPQKRANRGWYAAYDRMSLYGSRPEQEQGNNKLDQGWGNRYDLGFMLEEENGWAATVFDMEGPNAYEGFNRERLNRRNVAQQLVVLGVGGPGTPSFSIFPPTDRNNAGFNERFVEIQNSQNVVDFRSYELNKTWRLQPYHYGGILEPLVGLRYMKYSDFYQRESYNAGLFSDPTGAIAVGAAEIETTTLSEARNDMFGGQLGFRYFKFQDRFRYSAELRVFSMANFQCNTLQTTQATTYYAGANAAGQFVVPVGTLPQGYYIDRTRPLYGRNEEFVFGFDIRSEVSYQLTKMFEIRGGFQMIDFAQGIWRGRLGDPLARNDQQALFFGGTFGIAINR